MVFRIIAGRVQGCARIRRFRIVINLRRISRTVVEQIACERVCRVALFHVVEHVIGGQAGATEVAIDDGGRIPMRAGHVGVMKITVREGRIAQLHIRQVRLRQVGAVQSGATHVRAGQIRAAQVCVPEFAGAQVGVMEIGCGQVMEGEVPLPEVYAAEIGAGVRSPACRFQPRVAHVGEGAVRVAPVLGFVESSHGGFLPFWRTSLSCK